MNSTSIGDILIAHAGRYPACDIDDVYKLVHQAALGSEHAVLNTDHARRWLEEYWSVAVDLAKEKHLLFVVTSMEEWITRMRSLGFPAVHHSVNYEQDYHPAYRVVAREYFAL